jgi:drug/metabolite transporter (DMT)-like permease
MGDASRTEYRRGIAMTVVGSASWGLTGVLIRLSEGPGWSIVFWRSVFQILAMLTLIGWTERKRFGDLAKRVSRTELASGLVMGCVLFIWVPTLRNTTVACALVLQGTAPIFAALAGWLALRERPTFRKSCAIGVAFLGMLVMFGSDLVAGGILGDSLALLTGMLLGINIVILRSTMRSPDPIRSILISGGLAAVGALATGSLMIDTFPLISSRDLFLCLMMGGAQTAGFVLFNKGARIIPVADTGLVVPAETIVGIVLALLVLGEVPPPATIFGSTIVLLALTLGLWAGISESRSAAR